MDFDTENTTRTIEDAKAMFDWTDSSIFALMLIVSALIGVYFGCFGTKQKSPAEYLLGGKNMKVIPVALSLVATHTSSTMLIGIPAEVYTDGSYLFLVTPSMSIACILVTYLFIPVYCDLNITSAYEYFELRFNKFMRAYASLLYIVHCFLFLPPILYVPSAALSQVTGLNLYVISTVVAGICIFYTTIGGLKAVVWADFFQTTIMILSCSTIVIIGTIKGGGFLNIMNVADQGGRLDIFNFDPNPFQRNTFWTVFIGSIFSWTAILSANQTSIQRFLAVGTVRNAQMVVLWYWFGKAILLSVSIYGGLLVYSAYYGCDPIQRKIVDKPDQIFPYYVLDQIGFVPFLPGLFVAGVFSASLSSLSTALNVLAGTIYEDYVKTRVKLSEGSANVVMKMTVVIIGFLSVSLVFIVGKLGNIVPVTTSMSGVTGAPIFAMLALGTLFPFVNSKGAFAGSITCFALLSWIAIGSAITKVNHASKNIYPNDTCTSANYSVFDGMSYSNITNSHHSEKDEVFFLFRLSYMLYKAVGISLSLVVGIVVSYITGPADISTIDPKLISPPIRRFLPKRPQPTFEEDKLMVELKKINSFD